MSKWDIKHKVKASAIFFLHFFFKKVRTLNAIRILILNRYRKDFDNRNRKITICISPATTIGSYQWMSIYWLNRKHICENLIKITIWLNCNFMRYFVYLFARSVLAVGERFATPGLMVGRPGEPPGFFPAATSCRPNLRKYINVCNVLSSHGWIVHFIQTDRNIIFNV